MEMESGKIRAWPHFIHETSRHASKSEKIHETSKVMFFLNLGNGRCVSKTPPTWELL